MSKDRASRVLGKRTVSSSHCPAEGTSSDAATDLQASPTTTPASTAQASAAEPSVAQLDVLESVDLGEGSKRKKTTKRDNYLRWKIYFMGVACLAAKRSKDPRTKVGACIVGKDKKILGIGFNGMPAGCNEGVLPWTDNKVNAYTDKPPPDEKKWLGSKYPYVCHAASNAIQFSSGDLRGSTMYTTLYPVNECAKRISQAGITKVVYLKKDPKMEDATGITEMLFSRYPVIKLKKFPERHHQEIELKLNKDKEIQTESTDTPEIPSIACDSRDPITWDQYHMALARLAGERSKDGKTQVGACIVDDDHRVVSLGWNGMPKGNDDPVLWDDKMKFVCHAEFNALLHKTVTSVKGCKMYVTLHPCNWCTKDIIQAGIKEIIYLSWSGKQDKTDFKASQILLDATPTNRLTCRKFSENLEEPIVLKLNDRLEAEQPELE